MVMKRVEAMIKPWKLDDVMAELAGIGIPGMTIVEGKGFGKARGHSDVYRGAEYEVYFLPYVVMIIYSSDKMAPLVVETILKAARDVREGKAAVGIVTVTDLERAVSIRTGDESDAAL
jgi:nitrogen regulatory protein P-II 1